MKLRCTNTHKTSLESVEFWKYLAIHFSSSSSMNYHVDCIVAATCKTLAFIHHMLRKANSDTKLLAYTAIVRSKLEYASFIWSPHQVYLINKLESSQTKAVQFITGNNSQLLPMQARRKIPRLTFFHQLYHRSNSSSQVHILPTQKKFLQTDHACQVKLSFAHTNLLKFSLLHSAMWNGTIFLEI